MTQAEALSILKTGANVFLTGEPGSGKTHTINQYVNHLRRHGIEPAITASTGIAATHIGGLTIHSWSGLGIRTTLNKYDLNDIAGKDYVAKRVKRAKVLIIDEVSMLPPNFLLMLDLVCRRIKDNQMPFGGMQTILVGDFFQLPPIVRQNSYQPAQNKLMEMPIETFAYQSPAWRGAKLNVCYLTEQHRQDDADYLDLLSAIRRDEFGEKHLSRLISRKFLANETPEDLPKLFSHNVNVDRVNEEKLHKLHGRSEIFMMKAKGSKPLIESLKKGCLSPERLELRVGASVMFTKNNPKEGFYNGTLGTVEGFNYSTGQPQVRLKDGRKIEVEPMDWLVEENGDVRAKLSQLPLRLAWAITVHKSQGMSLESAVMDLSEVFEFGQGYVALSRVRRLHGLYLLGWNERAFCVHPEALAQDVVFIKESDNLTQELEKLSLSELSDRHEDFLTHCGGISEGVNFNHGKLIKKVKVEKPKTHHETLLLCQQKKTISQIAAARGLKEGTIISHIEKLLAEEQIAQSEIAHLFEAGFKEVLPDILAVFKELATDQLVPVFVRLHGDYSYEELRLARLMLIRSVFRHLKTLP